MQLGQETMHDQQLLNEYFSKSWSSTTHKYIYSGYAIVDKINDEDEVIDIGCGENLFKNRIKNLIGIDPCHNNADIICTLEEFEPKRHYDVALCLGSINFGDYNIIANQIERVNNLLFPCSKVFWRLNPGLHDHNNSDCNNINFFPWTFDILDDFAKTYGFEQINCAIDSNGVHERLYAEWHRGYY